MTIEIRFTESDEQQVRDNHSDAIADRLVREINRKNETLQWKRGIVGAKQRFYTTIEKNGEVFPEMFFNADRGKYRALFVWVESFEVFVFLCVFKKNDHYQTSKQHDVLEQVYQHPHRIVESAEQAIIEDVTNE